MIQNKSLQSLLEQINTGQPVLIYFSSEQCAICDHLQEKIQYAIEKNFDKMKIFEVKSDLHKEITSHFTVFSIPTTLVFFDKKEFMRVGRNLSIPAFIKQIKRVYDIFYLK